MEMHQTQQFAKKKKEADQAFAAGKKAISTNILKWSADHLGASLHFETAAKLYKEAKDDKLAYESFLKFAVSSEKINSLSSAAEGYSQAALLDDNHQQAEQYLKKAYQLYQIEGRGERGLQQMKKFGKQNLDAYEASSKKKPGDLEKILQFFKLLYSLLFESEDNYLFNQEIIDDYMNLLVSNHKFHEAIEARKNFIDYLKKIKEVDHQLRRGYLEIILLWILAKEPFKVTDAVKDLQKDVQAFGGNIFKEDECIIAEAIMSFAENLKDSRMLDADTLYYEWASHQKLIKSKAIFGFLNNEIVRQSKIQAMEETEKLKKQIDQGVKNQKLPVKQEVLETLDDIML